MVDKNIVLNKKKVFLKSGLIVLGLFLLYELIIYFMLNKLEIAGLIFFGLPILPFIILSSIFNYNDYFLWFSACVGYFLIGGFLGLFISKLNFE